MRNSFAKSLTKLVKEIKKLFYVLETLVINSLMISDSTRTDFLIGGRRGKHDWYSRRFS